MSRHTISNKAAFEQGFVALQARRPNGITRKTIDKIDELLGASGANLVYAGYPYDPLVHDVSKR
jgi:hypothetical protein